MAIFRKVHTEFWKDTRVIEELTPEDKLFFLYILTNSNTSQIGVYKITKKQIAFEIGYSQESVASLMQRFEKEHRLIRYNEKTREIAIKNWGKYNLNRGGKPVIDCIKKELKEVKDKSLLSYISRFIEREEIRELFLQTINDDSYNKYVDDSLSSFGQEEEKEEEEEEEEKESLQSYGENKKYKGNTYEILDKRFREKNRYYKKPTTEQLESIRKLRS